MNFILNRKIKYYTKESLRWISVLVFGLLAIMALIIIKFKIVYRVSLKEQEIGFVNNKAEIENAISEFTENKTSEVAYITLKNEPTFEMKLVTTSIDTNEEEVLSTITDTAIVTYKRYAITLDGEQKVVVGSMEEAQNVVEEIKNEFQQDLELNIAVKEIYDSNNIEVQSTDVAVATLNEDDVVQTKLQEQAATVNGILLHAPVTGTITSRFGYRRSGYHKGLDIAVETGTPIEAAAAGEVTFAGYKGLFGNLVIISHGNGVETYYAHCSKIYVSAGDHVEVGDVIAAVGSTGNSTGPHLHLEIWVDGVLKNPQNYLYR